MVTTRLAGMEEVEEVAPERSRRRMAKPRPREAPVRRIVGFEAIVSCD